ncbi:MAG: hypothetical protein RBS28_05660 [Rhodocyclaceae bacterium]|jgi:chromosome segregation ATPase|nr:hypothetical protein [Rhodocyclaceae bacterium]
MKRFLPWLCLLALPAWAQEATEDWDALREQARQMQAQASGLRTKSQQAHEKAERDCWKKFLVSDCQNDAKEALRAARQEAKRLEVEAGRIERRITEHERRERVARKQAERQAEIEQRRAGNAASPPSAQ